MAKAPLERGPTAEQVSRNIHSVRVLSGLGLKELSARMEDMGNPKSIDVLSNIELGDRRVDVDDLVALAAALGVNPNRLLLDPEASDEPTALTPTVAASRSHLWAWAAGDRPLLYPAATSGLGPAEDVRRFRRDCRPHDPPELLLEELPAADDVLGPVAAAVFAALDSGILLSDVVAYTRVMGTAHQYDRLARAPLVHLDPVDDGTPPFQEQDPGTGALP